MITFPRFFFDGNQWFGIVNGGSEWRHIVDTYVRGQPGVRCSMNALLEAKRCPQSRHGDMPNFGFRMEHTGEETLDEWAKKQGLDLLQLSRCPMCNSSHEGPCKMSCSTRAYPFRKQG